MSTGNPSALRMRVLRERNGRPSTDDRIVAYRTRKNITVYYYDADMKKTYTLQLDSYSLIDYVTSFVRAMSLDDDPFFGLQIAAPGYPAFLYTAEQLQRRRVQDAIATIARLTQESWFSDANDDADYEADSDSSSSTDSDASSTTASNTSSDSDDSMPPLIHVSAGLGAPRSHLFFDY